MRFDRFTEKAQEAVLDARTIAQEFNHPAIELAIQSAYGSFGYVTGITVDLFPFV